MKNIKDNIITLFLMIMIIVIFSLTVYFCLDVFGIIEVPPKYSIASLFYSQIEVIANGENYENTVPDNISEHVFEKEETNDVEIEVTEEVASKNDKTLEEIMEELENANTSQENTTNNQNINDNNSNKFYYEQLDEYGKIIYDKLYENIDELKTGTYTAEFDRTFDDLLHEENGAETLNNSFQLAINALTFDNPDLFYIDVTKMYLLTEITTRAFSKTYRVSIGGNGNSYLANDFNNQELVNSSIENVEYIKNEIINECKDKDTVEQIKIVHDYLVDTIEYDSTAGNNIYNIYGALISKRAVCEGYARAYKYILDDLGIPCIIACGIGRNTAGATESHAWNYVYVDDAWYALDVTWDDPVITGSGKINKEIKYAYFLKGANKFFEDHYEDGNIVGESNFKYPSLSVINYNK